MRYPARDVYIMIRVVFALAEATMFTVSAVYYVQGLLFSPFQLVLLGTALEATILLFEVPTGVVADLRGRRVSIITGLGVLGVSYLLTGFVPLLSTYAFPAVICTVIIRGIGWTFISGALSAWIVDEVGREHSSDAFLQATQFSQAAALVGSVLAAVFGSIALNAPYFFGGSLFLLMAMASVLIMPEEHFSPVGNGRNEKAFSGLHILRDGVRVVSGQPVLTMTLAVSFISGASSEGFDRLWEAHIMTAFTFPLPGNLKPVVWFGMIGVAARLINMTAAACVRRHTGRIGKSPASILMPLSAVHLVALLVFAVAGELWLTILAYLTVSAVVTVSEPIYEAWLNEMAESSSRATVLSMVSQLNAFGQAGAGPGVGYVGSRYSLRAAMVLAAVLLSPELWLYRIASRQNQQETKGPVGNHDTQNIK